MSDITKSIHEQAAITLSSSNTIIGEDRILKLVNVFTSLKLQKKPIDAAMKKLRKRMQPDLTDDEITKAITNADKSVEAIRQQQCEIIKTAKKLDNKVIPAYLVEMEDKDGVPTGNYCIDYMKYTDYIYERLHIVNLVNNLFIYDETNHVYTAHVNQIGTLTRNMVKEYGVIGKLSDIEHETYVHVKNMGCVKEYPFMGKLGTIHVKNGCLNLVTGKLEEPTYEHMYDYRVETEYKEFTETPELDNYLAQYGGTHMPIDLLAKVIWQRTFQNSLKEITVIYGPRDAAKSTLCEFVQSVLDGNITSNKNVTRSLLHKLLERFGFAGMEGKLMNFGDDLPDQFIRGAGRINEMVGGTNHHIEKKGKDGYDTFISTYYVFTCNNLPPLDDDDTVLWGKINLIHQDHIFTGKKIANRESLFTQVLKEQLLYRAVQKALSWLKEPYEKTQSESEVRRLWHEGTTDVDAFLHSYAEYDMSAFVSLEDIKKHYEAWAVMFNRKLYMKYLNMALKPFFTRNNRNNGYALRLIPLPKIELMPG